MEPTSESPFKRDEPVSGSWKWLLLASTGGAAWLVFSAWRRYERMASFEDFLFEFMFFALEVILFGLLVRAMWFTGACRAQRNFEIMAAAVRAQRPFWMLLTVAAAAASIYAAAGVIQSQPMNDYIKRWNEQHAVPVPAQPSPP